MFRSIFSSKSSLHSIARVLVPLIMQYTAPRGGSRLLVVGGGPFPQDPVAQPDQVRLLKVVCCARFLPVFSVAIGTNEENSTEITNEIGHTRYLQYDFIVSYLSLPDSPLGARRSRRRSTRSALTRTPLLPRRRSLRMHRLVHFQMSFLFFFC